MYPWQGSLEKESKINLEGYTYQIGYIKIHVHVSCALPLCLHTGYIRSGYIRIHVRVLSTVHQDTTRYTEIQNQKKDTGGSRDTHHTGHTRDARAHTGTRITQTNLTTIPTHQRTQTRTRTTARQPKPRPTQQPQPRSRYLSTWILEHDRRDNRRYGTVTARSCAQTS